VEDRRKEECTVLLVISRKEAGVRTERLCRCCCGGQEEGGMY